MARNEMTNYRVDTLSPILPKFGKRRRGVPSFLVLAAFLYTTSAVIANNDLPRQPMPTMRLIDGDRLTGKLVDCDRPDRLRWQCDAFTLPFEFRISGVSSISFPIPDEQPMPTGDYCFELADGDVLFGSLIRLAADEVEVELPQWGRVHLRRNALRRIVGWRNGANLVFAGLSGLENWSAAGNESDWREEGGHLITSIEGASVSADLRIPKRAIIEFEISWTRKPDFVLALGVGTTKKSYQEAYRFEVWDDEFVAVRETDDEADVSRIRQLNTGPGRTQLIAYLDQERGRLFVHSTGGKQLATLQFSAPGRSFYTHARLTNNRGDVRLERLRISDWSGAPPRTVQSGQARIQKRDGTIVYGQVQRYDAAADQLVVGRSGGTTRVRRTDVEAIVFAPTDTTRNSGVRVMMQNGVQLSGNLVKVDALHVYLDCPGIKERLALPVADILALLVLKHEGPSAVRTSEQAYIELDGVRLAGSLVDGTTEAGASCLRWHPLRSHSSSPLRESVSGKIIYRVPPSPDPSTTPQSQRPQRRTSVIGKLLGTADRKPVSKIKSTRSLHLRTGDTIPCEVTRIDSNGVTFSTPNSAATFVSHDKVKAVELADMVSFIKISRSERDRILTLPRMQRNNPPTHLIRSTRGDILRCRLQTMDDETVTAEVRLETKKVQRDRIAKIIWLHDDELDPSDRSASDESPPPTRVQALRSDGIRLTFVPDKMADGSLFGRSDVLGACHVDLAKVDQLLIGDAIEEVASGLAYQRWKLHHATEPRFVTEENGQIRHSPGTESALVGTPAPDFNLALVGGGRFHLDAHKGEIVVLDFWASWCGPCIQAMPEVEGAARQFEKQGVRCIAVNLQEDSEQVKSTLERHDLKPVVALDTDGLVAELYSATAIPQTVVIDRDGKIAYLFVGGGPRIGDQLHKALATLIE